MSTTELWVPIRGYESSHEISNMGCVRSLDRRISCGKSHIFIYGRLLKQAMDRDGYKQVGLCTNGFCKTHKVHRLVAQHFLPPSNLPEVNHIDLCKTNNAVSNLEWMTRVGNMQHALVRGRHHAMTNPNCARKLSAESVGAIRESRKRGLPLKDIAKRFNVSEGMVSMVANNKAWRTP